MTIDNNGFKEELDLWLRDSVPINSRKVYYRRSCVCKHSVGIYCLCSSMEQSEFESSRVCLMCSGSPCSLFMISEQPKIQNRNRTCSRCSKRK